MEFQILPISIVIKNNNLEFSIQMYQLDTNAIVNFSTTDKFISTVNYHLHFLNCQHS